MNQDNKQSSDSPGKAKRTISTKITCSACGKQQEVTIEIPEEADTPKMIWED